MRLDGKVVVVTGGASGLGAAAVRLFKAKGCKVAVWDCDEKLGTALAAELGSHVLFSNCDVTCPDSVAEALRSCLKAFGRVHVLVNCAGIIYAQMMYSSSKKLHFVEKFERVMRVNVLGTFNACRLVAERMTKQEAIEGERGVIINVASVAGYEGQRGQVAYGGSKGAILAMTLPIARDLAAFKIRVAAIAPGIFNTPMLSHADKDALKLLTPMVALGRLGDAEEFAHAVQFIVENQYVTGTNFRIDGGVRLAHL